jgi:hypothetical protein
MSSPALIALLAILAPLLGVFEKVAEIAASRAAKVSGPPSTVRATALQTQHEQLPSQAGLRFDRILGGLFLLFSAYLGWAGYRLALGQAAADPSLPQRLLGAALICEATLLAAPGIWHSLRLRNATEGRPLNYCQAEIELTGTRNQVTRECLHAMIGIGAIRAVGSTVSDEQDRVTIQGGTGSWGAWPQRGRGNEVTIKVITIKRGAFRVHIQSASYRAAMFDSYRNSRNIRNILRLLLY